MERARPLRREECRAVSAGGQGSSSPRPPCPRPQPLQPPAVSPAPARGGAGIFRPGSKAYAPVAPADGAGPRFTTSRFTTGAGEAVSVAPAGGGLQPSNGKQNLDRSRHSGWGQARELRSALGRAFAPGRRGRPARPEARGAGPCLHPCPPAPPRAALRLRPPPPRPLLHLRPALPFFSFSGLAGAKGVFPRDAFREPFQRAQERRTGRAAPRSPGRFTDTPRGGRARLPCALFRDAAQDRDADQEMWGRSGEALLRALLHHGSLLRNRTGVDDRRLAPRRQKSAREKSAREKESRLARPQLALPHHRSAHRKGAHRKGPHPPRPHLPASGGPSLCPPPLPICPGPPRRPAFCARFLRVMEGRRGDISAFLCYGIGHGTAWRGSREARDPAGVRSAASEQDMRRQWEQDVLGVPFPVSPAVSAGR